MLGEGWIAYFLVFCRVGTCLMIMPGLSSQHLPAQIRLFVAIAISLSIGSIVETGVAGGWAPGDPVVTLKLIGAELSAGVVIGLAGRLLFSAVQIAGAIIAQVSGYSGAPTVDDGSGEVAPEVGALISATVVVLLFVLDFHADIVRSLIVSYEILQLGAVLEPATMLDHLVDSASAALQVALRIAAPFIIAGVIVNFAFGMINKVAVQVPVIFISVPFVLLATLLLLLRTAADAGLALVHSWMLLFWAFRLVP